MANENIRIKPYFMIIGHSKDEVELRAGVWNKFSHTISDDTKSGKLFSIMKHLDGHHSTQEIAQKLAISRPKIEGVIDYLQSLNVLETSSSSAFDHYIDQYAPSLKGYGDTPKFKGIAYIGDEELADTISQNVSKLLPDVPTLYFELKNPLISFLTSSSDSWMRDGFKLEETSQKIKELEGYLVVLCLENVNPLVALKFNKVAHHLGITWIHCAQDGPFLFVGPTFQSHKSGPCFECFETLISMNLRENESYLKYKNSLTEGLVHQNTSKGQVTELINTLLASHVALEICNLYLTNASFTLGKVLSIYLPLMEISYNEVLKSSLCTTCGSYPYREDHQLYFDFQKLVAEEVSCAS